MPAELLSGELRRPFCNHDGRRGTSSVVYHGKAKLVSSWLMREGRLSNRPRRSSSASTCEASLCCSTQPTRRHIRIVVTGTTLPMLMTLGGGRIAGMSDRTGFRPHPPGAGRLRRERRGLAGARASARSSSGRIRALPCPDQRNEIAAQSDGRRGAAGRGS
jgi:hypothetical protein